MADDPPPVDAIPKAWMQLQAQVLEAQQSFWTRMTSVQKGGQDGSASGNASNVWDEARKLAEGWLTGLGPGAGSPGEGEGIAQVTLRRMMDPNQFLFAGTDEVNQTIQRLVDGTDSADIGRLEHHVLKATREWIALREASVEYRMVAAEAWMRAFSRFSASMTEHPEKHADRTESGAQSLARNRRRRTDCHATHGNLSQGTAQAVARRRRLPASRAGHHRALVRDPFDSDADGGRRPPRHRPSHGPRDARTPEGARADEPVRGGRFVWAVLGQGRRGRDVSNRQFRKQVPAGEPGVRSETRGGDRGACPREGGGVDVGATPKTLVLRQDKVALYHYDALPETTVSTGPALIVYGLIGRYTMADLQEDRSLVRNLLARGVDLYVVDWGHPNRSDQYRTLDDYVDWYLDDCIEHICRSAGVDRITLLGICEGGVFCTLYAALHPEKTRNLILTITPIDFHGDEADSDASHGFINLWTRSLEDEDIRRLVRAFGNLPGEIMAAVFQMMTPVRTLTKYNLDLIAAAADEKKLLNFLRMEKWLADRPHHPGAAALQWLIELYKENRLVKGTFTLSGQRIDLSRLTMPILNIYAMQDHIIPPPCSRALAPPCRHQGLHRDRAAGRACRRLRQRQKPGNCRRRRLPLAAATAVGRRPCPASFSRQSRPCPSSRMATRSAYRVSSGSARRTNCSSGWRGASSKPAIPAI